MGSEVLHPTCIYISSKASITSLSWPLFLFSSLFCVLRIFKCLFQICSHSGQPQISCMSPIKTTNTSGLPCQLWLMSISSQDRKKTRILFSPLLFALHIFPPIDPSCFQNTPLLSFCSLDLIERKLNSTKKQKIAIQRAARKQKSCEERRSQRYPIENYRLSQSHCLASD